MSLFHEIKSAGIAFDNHESDLYVPNTEQVRAIIVRHPLECLNARGFTHQVNGEQWLDVPFAFLPWWEAKARRF